MARDDYTDGVHLSLVYYAAPAKTNVPTDTHLSATSPQILLGSPITSDLVTPLIVGLNPVYVEGTEDQVDELRSLCLHLLVRVGFDSDDVANDVGMALDDLIDKFFTG